MNKFSGNNIFWNHEQGYLLKDFSHFLVQNSFILYWTIIFLEFGTILETQMFSSEFWQWGLVDREMFHTHNWVDSPLYGQYYSSEEKGINALSMTHFHRTVVVSLLLEYYYVYNIIIYKAGSQMTFVKSRNSEKVVDTLWILTV